MAFLPSDPVPDKARGECRAECEVCGPGSPTRAAGREARFMTSSRRALDEGGWVTRQVCWPNKADSSAKMVSSVDESSGHACSLFSFGLAFGHNGSNCVMVSGVCGVGVRMCLLQLVAFACMCLGHELPPATTATLHGREFTYAAVC